MKRKEDEGEEGREKQGKGEEKGEQDEENGERKRLDGRGREEYRRRGVTEMMEKEDREG